MLGYENWKPDDLAKLYANKNIWHNTTDENEKRRANEENKKLRAMYGMGDEHDVSIGELSHYRKLVNRQNAQAEHKNELLRNITDDAMVTNANVRNAANKVANFSYNPNTDVVYQSYADMYNRQGQSAAKQTMANLNASTMGRGNSYGAAATAQVQQAYAQKVSDMIPQLAQQEYDRLVQRYGMERDIADSLYNRQLNAYNAIANQEIQDIENDIRKYNRDATKLQLEYMPLQLKQDLESGALGIELSKLQIENMGYKNRKDAIAALIQETYGMRHESAKVIAAELDNMY
ncbi:MAG: hypothetical protein II244_04120 [Clostridia bacterium]|nr:hypothetical protein [Clostridia bacterium]